MFRKKRSWYATALKALLYAGVLYKLAGKFMKSTKDKKPRRKKSELQFDTIDALRRILTTLRAAPRAH